MQERSVIERIQVLEQNASAFEGLPDRVGAVELQILQLRDETRVEFSATRGQLRAEMQTMAEGLRREMRAMQDTLRGEIWTMQETLRGEISAVHEELVAVITHASGETRREMRVLYEDLKSTIEALGESRR